MKQHSLLFASLLLIGCTGTQITTTLQTVVDAVSIALPIITAAIPSLTPTQSKQIVGYLKAVSTAVQETTAELQTSDSSAIKASKIVAFFASAAIPAIPGLSPTVQLILQAVDGTVQAFLATFKPAAAAPRTAAPTPTPGKITFDPAALNYIIDKNTRNLSTCKYLETGDLTKWKPTAAQLR